MEKVPGTVPGFYEITEMDRADEPREHHQGRRTGETHAGDRLWAWTSRKGRWGIDCRPYQQAAADGHEVQQHVVHFAHANRHEPLQPLIQVADKHRGQHRKHESGDVALLTPSAVEEHRDDAVLDK